MDLAPRQIDLIRRSWAALEGREAAFADLFYLRLFTLAPETRGLFAPDMRAQRRKLADTLGAIVETLDAPQAMIDGLGRRHAGYGVREAHYAPLGDALIWTLDCLLEERFDPETRRAWQTAISGLSARMIAAQQGAEAGE